MIDVRMILLIASYHLISYLDSLVVILLLYRLIEVSWTHSVLSAPSLSLSGFRPLGGHVRPIPFLMMLHLHRGRRLSVGTPHRSPCMPNNRPVRCG